MRPMFPDLVLVRKKDGEYLVDILEPHDPSLSNNFEKAMGLAQFAEKHAHLLGRIQLSRKQKSPSGAEHFKRIKINNASSIRRLSLITSNPQLDEIFANHSA